MENWIKITSEKEVLAIIEASNNKPQIIFKHSVTCGISAHANEKLEDGNHLLEGKADFHYLDLLRYRSVSNFIAQELKVTHQSPQIIVLKNEAVAYTATHGAIDPQKIEIFL